MVPLKRDKMADKQGRWRKGTWYSDRERQDGGQTQKAMESHVVPLIERDKMAVIH